MLFQAAATGEAQPVRICKAELPGDGFEKEVEDFIDAQEALEASRTGQEALPATQQTGQEVLLEDARQTGQEALADGTQDTGREASLENAGETGQEAWPDAQDTGPEASLEDARKTGQEASLEDATKTGQEAFVEDATTTGQEASLEDATTTAQEASLEDAPKTGQEASLEDATKTGQEASIEDAPKTGQEASIEDAQRTGYSGLYTTSFDDEEPSGDTLRVPTPPISPTHSVQAPANLQGSIAHPDNMATAPAMPAPECSHAAEASIPTKTPAPKPTIPKNTTPALPAQPPTKAPAPSHSCQAPKPLPVKIPTPASTNRDEVKPTAECLQPSNPPEPPGMKAELLSNPPPMPSQRAINQRVNRLTKPRADGTIPLPPEFLQQWKDLREGGRERVLHMFEQCSWDTDGVVKSKHKRQ